MKRFTADFETATWLDDETFVWAWALCEIDNPEKVEVGNSIETFFERIKKECLIICLSMKIFMMQ